MEQVIWKRTDTDEFLIHENQTWLERDELRVLQKVNTEMSAVRNIISVDLTKLITEVILLIMNYFNNEFYRMIKIEYAILMRILILG